MTHGYRSLLAGAALLAWAAGAQAAPILSGQVSLIAKPTDATQNGPLSTGSTSPPTPQEAFLWVERTQTLGAAATVDTTSAGTFTSDPGSATIAAGTEVTSWFLFFDEFGGGQGNVTGSITFESAILGVIGQSSLLASTHATLGDTGTTTYAGGLQGIWDSATDSVGITLTNNTLDFTMRVGSAVDSIRILTAPVATVPGPAPLALLLFAALGLLRRGPAARA